MSRSDERNDSRSDDRSDRSRSGDDRSSKSTDSHSRGSSDRSSGKSFSDKLADRAGLDKAGALRDKLHAMRDAREFKQSRLPLSEIKAARAEVKGWAPGQVADSTRTRYDELNSRMAATHQRPEQIGKTYSSFRAYRAAAVHEARAGLKSALADRDKADRSLKASPKSAEARAAVRDAESRIRAHSDTLKQYPAGTGDPRLDSQQPSRYSGDRKADAARTTSKRDALDQRPADWRGKVWAEVSPRDKDAVAVLALTGARPSEIEKGVRVDKLAGGDLKFTIKGAKVDDLRGQQTRTITVSKADAERSVEGRHLSSELREGQGRTVQIGSASALSQRISRAGDRAGLTSDGQRNVSSYDYRHAFASRLKDDPTVSREELAAALGHSTERSQEAYGRAGSGSGGSGSAHASASSGVRAGR